MKRIYTSIVFAIFAAYIIYLGIQAESWGAKLIFILVGSTVLAISIYYEYLKIIYEKMIRSLTIDTDIPKSKRYRQTLLKRDWFNGFKNSLLLFDSLLLMDQGRYEECLELIDNHSQFFHSTVDYLYISYYNQLLCHFFLNQVEDAETSLKNLMGIKKLSKKKYSPLFSWDEIEAIGYDLANRHQKSLQSFNKVPLKQLNSREKAYHYYLIALQYKVLGNTKEYGNNLKKSQNYGQTMIIEKRC